MSYRAMSDEAAVALSGTTDPATQAPHTTIGVFNHAAPRKRLDARILELLAPLSQLEVYRDDAADTTVGVGAGRAELGGVVLVYAGGTVDLAAYDNDTAYLWLEDSGGGVAAVGHATDATGWPATPHLKLAEVTLAGGDIAAEAVLDRRPETLLRREPAAAAVADLDQTISDPPTQAEVQAISDKVDELLAALRAAGRLAT